MSIARRLGLACAGAALLGLAAGHAAQAHAVLLRASPASSQSLDRAPESVELLFSEPLDPVFSNVRVVDATGVPVDRGDSHVDADNDRLLVASLQPGLLNGIYSVNWRSLSTIDVHPDEGRYSMFIGVPVTPNAASAPSAVAQLATTPETTLARWWFYLAASVFGGVLATWKLVLGPAVRREDLALWQVAAHRVRRLVVVGGLLLIAGTLYAAVAQAAAAAHVPLAGGLGQPSVDLLGRGRFAAIWWPRFGIELAAVALVAIGGLEGMAAESALAMLPAILLTTSLTSHGAALPSGAAIGIVVDWLHVLGAAVWVGGLALLVVVAPLTQHHSSGSRPLLPHLIRGFARLGVLALAVVAISGAIQAVLELGRWDELVSSTYGQLVLAKVACLGVMAVLAGINTFARAGVPFIRGVRAELAAGVLIMGIAAVLTGLVPARNLTP